MSYLILYHLVSRRKKIGKVGNLSECLVPCKSLYLYTFFSSVSCPSPSSTYLIHLNYLYHFILSYSNAQMISFFHVPSKSNGGSLKFNYVMAFAIFRIFIVVVVVVVVLINSRRDFFAIVFTVCVIYFGILPYPPGNDTIAKT